MKRSPMPPRTQGLRQITPLARGDKPLARRTALRATVTFTRTPMPAIPAGLQAKPRPASGPHPFPASVTALLDTRDICQPDLIRCCQYCGSPYNLERHHRRGKDMGGSEGRPHAQCACNGVVLCAEHHRWAHRDGRVQAEAEGFVVSQAVDEPGTVSVLRFAGADGGARQWPSCDGRWLGADEMGEEAA